MWDGCHDAPSGEATLIEPDWNEPQQPALGNDVDQTADWRVFQNDESAALRGIAARAAEQTI